MMLAIGCLVLFVLVRVSYSVAKQPNVVLFLTDDQDVTLGGLTPMRSTIELVANEGVTVINAFATTPICCPSRASILTGLYQRNHRVFNNSIEGGCSDSVWQGGLEDDTFAVALKRANYSTFYAGKYLNQYGQKKVGGPKHVPPGWDEWVGLVGNSRYYNYTLSINGTPKYYENQYLTNVLKQSALDFLDRHRHRDDPFLMVIAPPAPHQPFTPEPRYKGVFKNKFVPRQPNFNTANNSDKHWLVRMSPSPLPKEAVTLLDQFYGNRWETLLSVDDLVKEVVEKLETSAILNDTYVIFTSDNGFHLGQFSMPWDKRQPYDFDTRVPFLVRGPGIRKKSVSTSPVALIDIYPTLHHIAGLEPRPNDGRSLLPIVSARNRTLIFEYKGEGSQRIDPSCPWHDQQLSHCSPDACCKCQDVTNNTYSCIRSIAEPLVDFLYCRFDDNESWGEAYNMTEDPFQLVNMYPTMARHEKKYFDDMLS